MKNSLVKRRAQIKKRVRSRIVRQSEYLRLSIHRTNEHIYAQVIDDFAMKTLVTASDVKLDGKKMSRTEMAQSVGKELAAAMKAKKISQVVFDRGCYPYKGRIKALAEAVKEGGITI
jgi:large subunit ribosomal protein L18